MLVLMQLLMDSLATFQESDDSDACPMDGAAEHSIEEDNHDDLQL
jgi:hypothetical protein